MIRVSVDTSRCQGHARCFGAAPDIFDFDEEGYAFVPQPEQPELTPELKLAVANCPERAVVITELTSS